MDKLKGSRFAVISDIHANLEALRTVFDVIEAEGVTRVVCLGDIVGYGPDFEICTDIIKNQCELVLCGNHDEAVIEGPIDFNPVARDVINYTRSMMKPNLFSPLVRRNRWGFLKGLSKDGYREPGLALYHGSPRDPVKEYIMRTDVVFAQEKLTDIFSRIDGICFIGHTHQPGVIEDESSYFFNDPQKLGYRYSISDRKAVINVGSVGQPRDNDNRASFVIVTGDEIQFQRVEYDYRTTMEKIRANPDIHNNCAARLEWGK